MKHNTRFLLAILLFLPCLLVLTRPAGAVLISVENSATDSITNTGTSTISGFTVGNNANRMLVVAVGGEFDSVASVTYGGTPLTQSAFFEADNGPTAASLWTLNSPAVGSGDVVVTLAAGTQNGAEIGVLSVASDGTLTLVDTDTDGHGPGNSSSGTISLSPSTAIADDYFFVSAAERQNNGSISINPDGDLLNLFTNTAINGGAARGAILPIFPI